MGRQKRQKTDSNVDIRKARRKEEERERKKMIRLEDA